MLCIIQVDAEFLKIQCAVKYVYTCDYLNLLTCAYGIRIMEDEVTNLAGRCLAICDDDIYGY